jgi:hypothetical protein
MGRRDAGTTIETTSLIATWYFNSFQYHDIHRAKNSRLYISESRMLPRKMPPGRRRYFGKVPPEAGGATKRKRQALFRGSGVLEFNPAATYSPTEEVCSTIGAGGLNYRVRDGNGCGPSAIATGNLKTYSVFRMSYIECWRMLVAYDRVHGF